MFSGICCWSVQVTEAGGLPGFLHEGTELELLPGQKTYVLEEETQKVKRTESTHHLRTFKSVSLKFVYTGKLSDTFGGCWSNETVGNKYALDRTSARL